MLSRGVEITIGVWGRGAGSSGFAGVVMEGGKGVYDQGDYNFFGVIIIGVFDCDMVHDCCRGSWLVWDICCGFI